ncbi:MAG: class I SAM-dependent methyltransferase [Erysipelotrichaceae bacterium]|nr:class I SAM-dependent methyltransferase [Erysipelotrichaceae bacterium]
MSHYFENDKDLKSKKMEFKYTFNNKEYIMKSDFGVFSKDELDEGTAIFLNVLKEESLNGRILDLGCGIGCLGITLASIFPESKIEGVDVNERALSLCNENILLNKINNYKVYESNICSNVKGLFNMVVTNPPIRAGKEVVFSFFSQAYNCLDLNGILYVVNRKSHGAKSSEKKLIELFGNCEILEKKKGFYILKSIKCG